MINKRNNFSVGNRGVGAENINVTLNEFPVASPLGIFCPPDRLDLVAAERQLNLVVIQSQNLGYRHGQIVSETDIAATIVGKKIAQLFEKQLPAKAWQLLLMITLFLPVSQ